MMTNDESKALDALVSYRDLSSSMGNDTAEAKASNAHRVVEALIAERDSLRQEAIALRQWRFECCEALGLSCAAGAEWTVDDVFRCVLHEESKIIADRDSFRQEAESLRQQAERSASEVTRLAAEVLRLQAERDAMAKDVPRPLTVSMGVSSQFVEGWNECIATMHAIRDRGDTAALSPATKSPASSAGIEETR